MRDWKVCTSTSMVPWAEGRDLRAGVQLWLCHEFLTGFENKCLEHQVWKGKEIKPLLANKQQVATLVSVGKIWSKVSSPGIEDVSGT